MQNDGRSVSEGEAADRSSRFVGLDGLRGIAVIMVMATHFGDVQTTSSGWSDNLYTQVARCGWMGVQLFFVLSGFLITRILLRAKEAPDAYFRTFYWRRSLRIFPLYFGYLAAFFGAVTVAYAWGKLSASWVRDAREGAVWLWTYTSNIWTFVTGRRYRYGTGHLWSLAIEEQFYMVWPLLVYLLTGRWLLRTIIVMILASAALRAALEFAGVDNYGIYVLTFTQLDALGLGALLAFWRVEGRDTRAMPPWAIGLVTVALAACIVQHVRTGWWPYGHGWVMSLGVFANAIVSAAVVFVVAGESVPRLNAWLGGPVLQFLGRYSYGLYVLHYPISRVLIAASGTPRMIFGSQVIWCAGVLVVGVAVTSAVAVLSWRVLEQPFLRLKDRTPWGGATRDRGVEG